MKVTRSIQLLVTGVRPVFVGLWCIPKTPFTDGPAQCRPGIDAMGLDEKIYLDRGR